MLGMDETEARGALTGLVFTDPVTDELVHAPAYVSGDVRAKLDAAKARAADDPEFQTNVDALTEVLPETLGVEDITARLGAVWISADVHEQCDLPEADIAQHRPLSTGKPVQNLPFRRLEPRIAKHPPDPDVRVEQRSLGHCSASMSDSLMTGANGSPTNRPRPRSASHALS